MDASVISRPVLVVWEHGGNLGHVARLLPIVDELLRRGQRVVLAVAQPSAVEPLFAHHTQVKVLQLPQVIVPLTFSNAAVCPADIWLRCGFASPPHAKVCAMQWIALFEDLDPAVVLVDASPMALYATYLAGIPCFAVGHGFELPPLMPGQNFTPWESDISARTKYSELVLKSALIGLANALMPEMPSASTRVTRLREATSVGALLELVPHALCAWPELDHFDRDRNTGCFLGPIWNSLPHAQPLVWPDKPGAKVLCYIGLVDKSLDLLWQALQKFGANVVVLSPAGHDWACEAARGWGIVVRQQPVLLESILPGCDAVIGHGGMGFTSMALHAGKPVMLLPTQLEQGLLAYQLCRRGLAINITNCLNMARVKTRVTQLLQDAALSQRVKEISMRYADFSPQHPVELIVNKLLGTITATLPNSSMG